MGQGGTLVAWPAAATSLEWLTGRRCWRATAPAQRSTASCCCCCPSPCRAAFDGDLEELAHLLAGLTLRQKLQLDTQGNTARGRGLHGGSQDGRCVVAFPTQHRAGWRCSLLALPRCPQQPRPPAGLEPRPAQRRPPHPTLQALHVAVLRRQYDAIQVLLDAGLPADVKNERMWNPIDEAVALRDARAAKILYTCGSRTLALRLLAWSSAGGGGGHWNAHRVAQ